MINEVYTHSSAHLDLFRQKVVAALRQTGRLQRELAQALGINPQVLSRKLHGIKQTLLTHTEVKLIIKTLATWDAITTQTEAIDLLSLMGLKIESFSDEEWNTPPLNRLEATSHPGTPTSALPTTYSFSSLAAPSTSLLGREQHVQMLLNRLRQTSIRLLTLLGTGGVGKTRLALEVARTIQHDFADGVFFVPLATLRDAALIPSTIMQTLPIIRPIIGEESSRQNIPSQEDILKAFLRDKELLLVLDNVEHLSTIAPFISDLLSSAPSLKILVTSRTVLHLYGEQEFDTPPLDFGMPNQATDLDTVSQFSAIRLFVERAQAINPAFQITQQNAAIIARICTRLDGLPLAIELAAARTKVLPLSVILQRLTGGTGQSLTFLQSKAHNTLQRHQTLQETLDWSYDLLQPQQQRFFRHLGIFSGNWTAQAALSIAIAEEQAAPLDHVLEQLETLIDHSLVKRVLRETDCPEEHLELRFYFLETIRTYARNRLISSGEDQDIQRRHATYYLALVEATEPDLSGQKQAIATSLLLDEQDNLRAALSWAIEHTEIVLAQRMCGALSKFWEARAQFQEAHLWIDATLKMTQETSPIVHPKLLMAASRLALWEVNCERSRELAQKALALYETSNDSEGKALAIFQIGDTWHMQGEYTLATRYLEESLHLLHEQKNWGLYAFTLSRLGAIAILQGNFSQAWTQLQDALPLLRLYSEPGLLNVTLVYLGTLALAQGDAKQSVTYLREGLLLAQHIDNHYMLATTLITLGCLLGTALEPAYAAHICSAAEALFTSLNTALPTAYQPLYNAYLASLQFQVDETLWQTWWAEGKTLSLEQVSTLALKASLSNSLKNS